VENCEDDESAQKKRRTECIDLRTPGKVDFSAQVRQRRDRPTQAGTVQETNSGTTDENQSIYEIPESPLAQDSFSLPTPISQPQNEVRHEPQMCNVTIDARKAPKGRQRRTNNSAEFMHVKSNQAENDEARTANSKTTGAVSSHFGGRNPGVIDTRIDNGAEADLSKPQNSKKPTSGEAMMLVQTYPREIYCSTPSTTENDITGPQNRSPKATPEDTNVLVGSPRSTTGEARPKKRKIVVRPPWN
jgi:hypothetical protein